MEARQLITGYRDASLPMSRIAIASFLNVLEGKVDNMTKVEREIFEFMKTEFKYEMLKLQGDEKPSEIRWHIYSGELTGGIINCDLDYSIAKRLFGKQSNFYRSQGFKVYGYVYKNVGYYFNIVDNLERGDRVDYGRLNNKGIDNCQFLSEEEKEYYRRIKSSSGGVIPSQINSRKQFQYDEIDAVINWQIGDFVFSLEKISNAWGYGKTGRVILSNNAPSYPQIKLQFQLSKDISFIYFHGELNSNVVDSSRSYIIIYNNPAYIKSRTIEHTKYIAAHQIEFSIWNGFDLALGESVIYSDRGPLLIYLIPVMFFKAAEHYNDDKDNCQLFGSLDLNLIKNVNLYFSLFIDEINTDQLFDPYRSHRQIAFNSGIQLFDLPFTNTDVRLEYTRLNPAVYNHSIPSVTFENNGFVLGNWMGQNSDNLYCEVGIIPKQGLRFSLFGNIFRKGAALSIFDQYSERQGEKPFLFGPLHEERSVGFAIKYQPLRDIFIDINGRFHRIRDELCPSMNKNFQFEFFSGISLGIW